MALFMANLHFWIGLVKVVAMNWRTFSTEAFKMEAFKTEAFITETFRVEGSSQISEIIYEISRLMDKGRNSPLLQTQRLEVYIRE